ncbi:MAG: Zn-ribbon domain-containing OB-fold protein [archaeon]
MSDEVRDAGYDDFFDALADCDGYYLECENAHGSLPPRLICPECGSSEFTEEPLPDAGEVDTFTITRVAMPDFEADEPYVTAIADFGPIRLTGQVRGVDHGDVETGMVVEPVVEETETAGDRLLVFRPR